MEATACPECGAIHNPGQDCWHVLGQILALESLDPELQKKHFLTVATYNLQRPSQFTDEALSGLGVSLSQYLDDAISVAEIRKRNARRYDGASSVRKPQSERTTVRRNWPMTVVDVYTPGPVGIAKRVQAWAESVRGELDKDSRSAD